MKEVMNIVQGSESGEKNLAGQEKVTEIGAAECPAGVAGAGWIERSLVVLISGLLDDYLAS
jgi:hypothetical protein